MTMTKQTTDEAWKTVREEVAKRIDLADACARRVFDEWTEKATKRCEIARIGEPMHTFGPEVTERAIEFLIADLDEDIQLRRAELAKEKRRLAGTALRTTMLECDGVVVESDEETYIVPELLRVVHVDRKKKKALLRQVIAASRQMAADDDDENTPDFPKALGADIDRFSQDLREFLDANGAAGREAVLRVCDNADAADEFAESDDAPAPLRFLAGLCRDLGKACLREPRNNGFGFSRR